MSAKQRPRLQALARRVGILPEYVDSSGKRRFTSDRTRVALLAALGFDASTERAAGEAIRGLRWERDSAILEPVEVVTHRDGESQIIRVRVPRPARTASWSADLTEEDGTKHEFRGRLEPTPIVPRGTGLQQLVLKAPLSPGYHQLTLTIHADGREHRATQSRIVVPRRCPSVKELLKDHQAFGLCVNLYSVRSAHNWGIGDLGDLSELCRWAAEYGANFVGLNPLHAVFNRGMDISPYSPVSRVFRSTAYLDVCAIPEFARCREAQQLVASPAFQKELAACRSARRLEYEHVSELKLRVLRLLHRLFTNEGSPESTGRGLAYREYLHQEGQELSDFATFLTLDEQFRGRPWQRWPAAYRDPTTPEVAEFRRGHADEVGFHCFLQFELDRQLGASAQAARGAGMSIGLFQDLAIGISRKAADAWAHPGLFVTGADLGAPPDEYAKTGQNWELPPLNPLRLRADGYRYWIRVLRHALAHSGAVRIDHAMGLLRQYWIPAGEPGSEGAYVRFPWDDLVGILTLESTRQNALVIGEDLGTVPRGFGRRLEDCNILSTRVMFFERTPGGGFRPAKRYSNRALVTATTHDFGPLAGYWESEDLKLRRRAGAIPSDGQLRAARVLRQRDRQALIRRLVADGALKEAADGLAYPELYAAIHQFLRRTPAPLLGVMLDDLASETRPVNLPGVAPRRFRSWSRPMTKTIEEMRAESAARLLLSNEQNPPYT